MRFGVWFSFPNNSNNTNGCIYILHCNSLLQKWSTKTVEKPKHKTAASFQKQQWCNQCWYKYSLLQWEHRNTKKIKLFCLLTKSVQNRGYKHFHVHNSNHFCETFRKFVSQEIKSTIINTEFLQRILTSQCSSRRSFGGKQIPIVFVEHSLNATSPKE